MLLEASDSDDDLELERSRARSDIMDLVAEDELLEEGSGGKNDTMNASDASRDKLKGNSNTRVKGGASFANTTRVELQTRGINGEKRNASIVSLADVEDDGQELDDESSSEDIELPAHSKYKPSIQPGTRRGRSTKKSGFSTDDNVDGARSAHVSKKRRLTPKMPKADTKGEHDGLSKQSNAKRRGRPATVPSATRSSPGFHLASRGRGRQNAPHDLAAANETGQRRSARAAAAEAKAKSSVEDKAKKSQAIISTTKPTCARGGKPAANKRGEYFVEAIVDHRLNNNGSPEYFIKWERYPASQNSWEPKNNLRKCKAALNDYLKRVSEA